MSKKLLVVVICLGALAFSMLAFAKPERNIQRSKEQPPPEVPDQIVYKHLFHHVAALKKKAGELEQAGKDGAQLRTHYQRKADLSADESRTLDEIAVEFSEQLQVLDLRARALIGAYRARFSGGQLPHGEKPQPPPAELRQMTEERDAMVLRARDRLRAAFGEQEFKRFNDFVKSRVAPDVQMISPQQTLPGSGAGPH